MNVTAKIAQSKEREGKRYDALSAAHAILQMDPHARKDLITYLQAFNECEIAGDEQEQEYLANAILEVLEIHEYEDGPDLDGWETQEKSTPGGAVAAEELAAETNRFFDAYSRLKAASGLTTIRAIASAAGLSTTTVQAIEKQRVKPQFKTLSALAKAFKVDVRELLGR